MSACTGDLRSAARRGLETRAESWPDRAGASGWKPDLRDRTLESRYTSLSIGDSSHARSNLVAKPDSAAQPIRPAIAWSPHPPVAVDRSDPRRSRASDVVGGVAA